jgi:hypothetical protein
MVATTDSTNDFDFEIGSWHVKHRRLKERLSQCNEWETFDGTSTMQTVMGGYGNIEDNLLMFPSGPYRAIAIRSYDPITASWAIWWLASNDPHTLDVPVIGRFKDGIGAFYADDTLRAQPVRVRFLWLRTDARSPRWEQAMSTDDESAFWAVNTSRKALSIMTVLIATLTLPPSICSLIVLTIAIRWQGDSTDDHGKLLLSRSRI